MRALAHCGAACGPSGRCRRLLVLVVAAAEIAWATGGSVTQGVVVVALINLILVVGLYVFVGNSGRLLVRQHRLRRDRRATRPGCS